MIEFATKTAEAIQSQAGQVQAISHVLLIALVTMSEQQPNFKRDFIDRIVQIREHLSDRQIDQFTREYIEELVRFLEDPYQYSRDNVSDSRPKWFKGIISSGKPATPTTDSDQ